MQTQMQQFWSAHRKIADRNAAFMDMVNCRENPMTREDLEALIARRPEIWGQYSGFLDTLPSRSDVENAHAA